jgi:hypothetical protein
MCQVTKLSRNAHCHDRLVSKQLKTSATKLYLLLGAIQNDGYLLFQLTYSNPAVDYGQS